MNKILVTVYVLSLEIQYDILIPINLGMKEALDLMQKSIVELTSGSYKKKDDVILFNEDGNVINYNNIVKFSGLKNGSKIMMV